MATVQVFQATGASEVDERRGSEWSDIKLTVPPRLLVMRCLDMALSNVVMLYLNAAILMVFICQRNRW